MAKNIIDLTLESSKTLQRVDAIVRDKEIKKTTDKVNCALEMLGVLIDRLDDESFIQLTGYKK